MWASTLENESDVSCEAAAWSVAQGAVRTVTLVLCVLPSAGRDRAPSRDSALTEEPHSL